MSDNYKSAPKYICYKHVFLSHLDADRQEQVWKQCQINAQDVTYIQLQEYVSVAYTFKLFLYISLDPSNLAASFSRWNSQWNACCDAELEHRSF